MWSVIVIGLEGALFGYVMNPNFSWVQITCIILANSFLVTMYGVIRSIEIEEDRKRLKTLNKIIKGN